MSQRSEGPRLQPSELKALQVIHKMMLELEKASTPFSESSLSAIRSAMAQLETLHEQNDIPSQEVQKIASIAHHLHVGMTAKEFSSWIVPVERILGRELRDDQFLIYTQDASAPVLEKLPLVFVLDNLRSAFNVGSIFRTAECFGVSQIFLAGYTPLPNQDKLAKTAMGTDAMVSWQETPKAAETLMRLRQEGYAVIGFETTSHASDVSAPFGDSPTAFVFGNERFGLSPDLLELCTEVRKIPLRGQKNSLNVGVATAIATYEFARQFAEKPGLK